LNQTVCLYEFGTAERASSPSCQVNCFTGEAYNPYGVEIPFQFDGQDGTMTATHGDATPQGLVLQVHSSSRISIGNLAPIQASGAMCCTLYGEGEEATCPADGGPEEECSDSKCNCTNTTARYFFHPSNMDWRWAYITDGINDVIDLHPFLNQASEQRLKDAGLDDSVVTHASGLVGSCLAAGGKAECYQYECDGYCSLKCECSIPHYIDNQDPCFK
jgi:hypothetical protein